MFPPSLSKIHCKFCENGFEICIAALPLQSIVRSRQESVEILHAACGAGFLKKAPQQGVCHLAMHRERRDGVKLRACVASAWVRVCVCDNSANLENFLTSQQVCYMQLTSQCSTHCRSTTRSHHGPCDRAHGPCDRAHGPCDRA